MRFIELVRKFSVALYRQNQLHTYGMLTYICGGETVSYVRVSQHALRCRCLLGKEWEYCNIP